VTTGTKMGLMFEVAEGGFLDIDVRVWIFVFVLIISHLISLDYESR
jgi:hypothetical protein